jgi:hypothetical protein
MKPRTSSSLAVLLLVLGFIYAAATGMLRHERHAFTMYG